jgi:hypothetical protein
MYGRHSVFAEKTELTDALSDLMSIMGAFAVARFRIACPAIADDKISTWQKREVAWKKQFSLDLSNHLAWRQLRGFVEARNAAQHGRGRLTDLQLGAHRDEILDRLRDASVHLDGNRVVLTKDDLARCQIIAAAVVEHLDRSTPQ